MNYWLNFKKLYEDELKNKSSEICRVFNEYGDRKIRTALNTEIISNIALHLKLNVKEEYPPRIDFALVNNLTDKPIVLIEHENDIDSDPEPHEINKLSFASAELKVFITWFSGDWKNKREEYTNDWWWYEVNKTHSGALGLIIGEANPENKTIRYYSEI